MSPFGHAAGPVLVLMPSWVGDIVMAIPALRAIAAAARRGDRAVAAVVRPAAAPLLAGLVDDAGTPLIDETIELDLRGLGGLVRGAATLRRRRMAAAVLLPNSFRSALAVVLARVPCRLGYATDGRALLLHRPIRRAKPRDPIPTVDWYTDLAERILDLTIADRRPRLMVTDAERDAAATLLDGLSTPFVLLNPGANRPDKRWPAERFAALAARLHRRHGLGVAVTGSPAERPLTAEVASRVGALCDAAAVDLAARGIGLGALKAVAAAAALVVSNDTGPRHISLALSTPTLTLFGPTDHRWTTVADTVEHRLVAEPFLPAEECADRRAAHCAIDRIAVGDAAHAADVLLARAAPRS